MIKNFEWMKWILVSVNIFEKWRIIIEFQLQNTRLINIIVSLIKTNLFHLTFWSAHAWLAYLGWFDVVVICSLIIFDRLEYFTLDSNIDSAKETETDQRKI